MRDKGDTFLSLGLRELLCENECTGRETPEYLILTKEKKI